MASLDEIFYKEFQESMRFRKANSIMNLRDVPTPENFGGTIPIRNMAIARGITDEKYSALNYDKTNKTLLSLVGNTKLRKTVYLSDGTPRREADGTIRTTDVIVPRECEGVISNIPISSLYTSRQGFEFVDRIKDRVNSTKFIYIVPRKYLHRINLCALVIRLDKLRNSYTAIQVTLINGHKLYIHVIPYKPTRAKDEGTRVLKVKANANFDAEIKDLLAYWQQTNVMFSLESTAFEEPIRGVYNCGIEHYDTNLSNYRPFESKSLAEEGVIEDY